MISRNSQAVLAFYSFLPAISNKNKSVSYFRYVAILNCKIQKDKYFANFRSI